MMIDLFELIVINRINVCPGESCCKFDFETGKCNLTAASYVTLYYGKDANYSRFKSECEDCLRNIIALKIGDSEISLTQSFEVKKGNKLEIYFSSYPLNTLSYFLDGYIEIISADFSHFDASNIEEIDGLFYDCESLKSVNITSFKSLKIQSLKDVFKNCRELTSIDLSNVSNNTFDYFYHCFNGCISLKFLDISGLDFSNAESDEVFTGVTNLKYLNIKRTKLKDELKSQIPKKNLIICQDDDSSKIEDDVIIDRCCNLNEDLEKCNPSNYIVIYYAKDVNFTNTLNEGVSYSKQECDYTEKISFLYLDGEKVAKDGNIPIKTGSKFEIYFSSPLESLDKFFDIDNCNYAKNIISVDFSHLDFSILSSINYLFSGCSTLESVDLSNNNKAPITQMDGVFNGCNNLKSVNLSRFDTASLNTLNNVFDECNSLNTIYMSGLDLSKVKNVNSVFNSNLKYLDIIGAKLSANIKNAIWNQFTELTICQENGVLTNSNNQNIKYKEMCCHFNSETGKCESLNYITVYFPQSDESNGYRFSLNSNYKDKIAFINNGNSLVLKDDDFPITVNQDYLEIHFQSDITSLEGFFDGETEKLMKNIISVDLSHFDSSYLTSVNKMFYQCTSLKLVNFRNFKTENITDMSSMFSGSTSLQYLDISSFNLEKVSNFDNMFEGIEGLKYINLWGVQYFNKNIVENSLNKIKGLIVCQKENIITNEQAIKRCCIFDTAKMECEVDSLNYLSLVYGKHAEYKHGFNRYFGIDGYIVTRENISFIIYQDDITKKISPEEELIIEAGAKITVYFSFSEIDLRPFFSSLGDINVYSLISIDLSHFNASSMTIMNNLFGGLEMLKSVDLTNLDTSKVTDMNSMFSGCVYLQSIDLSNLDLSSVESMQTMFDSCISLKFINLSNKDISSVTDMSNMFFGCISLISVDLSNSKIPALKDMSCMFLECNSLISVDLSNLQIPKLEDMSYMFSGCISLISVNLSNFEALSLNDIECMFYGCISLKSLDLSSFYTASINCMNQMFGKCLSLESLDLSNFNTTSVNDMERMFYGCKSLISIDLSSFDTLLVEKMNYMFYGCNSLEYLDISNFNTPSILEVEYIFFKCSKLKYLFLTNFNTSLIEDMSSMFEGCRTLKLLDINHFKTEQVYSYEKMFSRTEGLKYLNIYEGQNLSNIFNESILNNWKNLTVCEKEDFITGDNIIKSCCHPNFFTRQCDEKISNYIEVEYGSDIVYNGGFGNAYRKNISFIIEPDNITKRTINEKLIVNSGEKIKIIFPDKIQSLDNLFNSQNDPKAENITSVKIFLKESFQIANLSYMFTKCSSLKSIEIKYFNSSSVTEVSNIFSGCSSLDTIDLSFLNQSSLNDMSSIFSGCCSLESIDLSHIDTSSVNDMSSMISGCTSLKSINLSNFDTSKVTNMNNMLSECSSLDTIDLSHIDISSVNDMSSMFSGCSSLKSINLSNFDTSKVTNMNNMFSECSSI